MDKFEISFRIFKLRAEFGRAALTVGGRGPKTWGVREY